MPNPILKSLSMTGPPSSTPTSTPSTTKPTKHPRRKPSLSGSESLALHVKPINTTIRSMPLQPYAVPPTNTPIMEFSRTAESIAMTRGVVRRDLREKGERENVKIQMKDKLPKEERKRINDVERITVEFYQKTFDDGIVEMKNGLIRRQKFISDLVEKDRKRFLEDEIKNGRDKYDEAEKYVFDFRKGSHLTELREVTESNDIFREEKLYGEARDAILESEEFRNDWKSFHVGEVSLRPSSELEISAKLSSERYIEKNRIKEEASNKVLTQKNIADDLYKQVTAAETKVRDLSTTLEQTGSKMTFESRILNRKIMLKIKDEADRLRNLATIASSKASKVKSDMLSIVYSGTVTPLDFEEMEGSVIPNIDAWVLSMPVDENEGGSGSGLGEVYYGSFSTGNMPPLKNWVKVHRDAEVDPLIVLQGPSDKQVRMREEQIKAMDDEMRRKIEVEDEDEADENVKGKKSLKGAPIDVIPTTTTTTTTPTTSKIVLSWQITGCKLPICNGRYIESGHTDGILRFQNTNGVLLHKTQLKETPDLDITAATCNEDGVAGHDMDLSRKLMRIVALPDVEILGSDLDVNPDNWGRDFNSIARAGLSMVTLGVREKARRKLEQKGEAEKRVEGDFKKAMEEASLSLDAIDGDGDDENDDENDNGVKKKKKKTKKNMKKRVRDHTSASLFPPNTTYQANDNDIQTIIPGADRIIPVSPASVPLLCRPWVLLSCPKKPNHCKHRHYYCSLSEKNAMVEYRQNKDTKAEIAVLKCISVREVVINQVKKEAEVSSHKFFNDSEKGGVEEGHVKVLLTLLDRLRLVTVQTCEAIGRWREAVEKQALLRDNDNEDDDNGNDDNSGDGEGGKSKSNNTSQKWVVTIAVSGPQLYSSSPAFRSSVKRYRRDLEPTKNSNNVRYLGVFKTKVEAARAYDAAMLKEAVKVGSTASRMPGKRFVLRACQKHYAVESVTSPKYRPCEQCMALKYAGGASSGGGVEYTPTYIWNGENYLLKISEDLEFLKEHEALRQWLGKGFVFDGNPFLLAEEVDQYISMADDDGDDGGDSGGGLNVPKTPMGSVVNREDGSGSGSGSRSRMNSPMTMASDMQTSAAFQSASFDAEVEMIRGSSAPFSFSGLQPSSTSSRSRGASPNQTHSHSHSHSYSHSRSSSRPNTTSNISTQVSQHESISSQIFGNPSLNITKLKGGWTKWGDKTVFGTKFFVDLPFHSSSSSSYNNDDGDDNDGVDVGVFGEEEKKDAYPASPPGSPQETQRLKQEQERQKPRSSKSRSRARSSSRSSSRPHTSSSLSQPQPQRRVFEVLDISRITTAWKVVQQETMLNDLLSHDDSISSSVEPSASLSSHPLGYMINNGSHSNSHTQHNSAIGNGKTKLSKILETSANFNSNTNTIANNPTTNTNTYAVYTSHTATLTLPQSRPPLLHRDSQIWCRSDIGEWSGLRQKGPHMKSFEHAVKVKEDGKLREYERTRVAASLRSEVGKDISVVNVRRIAGLMEEAGRLKGVRLKHDVDTAELFLRRFDRMSVCAVLLERRIRGFLGRRKSSQRHTLVISKDKERRDYFNVLSTTARLCVARFTELGARKALRCLRLPVFKSVRVMNGEYWMVSVSSLGHRDYVDLSLPSSSPSDDTDTAADTDTGNKGQSKGKGQSQRQRLVTMKPKPNFTYTYDPASDTFKYTLTPNTDARITTPERILVKAYACVTGETLSFTIDEETLRRRLRDSEMYGYGFGLDDDEDDEDEGRNDKDTSVSNEVSLACTLSPLAIDPALNYGDPNLDLHNNNSNVGVGVGFHKKHSRKCWEPLKESRQLKVAMLDAVAASVRVDRVTAVKHGVMVDAGIEEQRVKEHMEGMYMAHEEANNLVCSYHSAWQDLVTLTSASIKFSADALGRLEDLSKPDWTQSWDPFENGNNWTLMVQKRKAEVTFGQAVEDRRLARVALFSGVCKHGAARLAVKLAEGAYFGSVELKKVLRERAGRAVGMSKVATAMMNHVLNRLIPMLMIRVRATVPIAKQIVWRERTWGLTLGNTNTPQREIVKQQQLQQQCVMVMMTKGQRKQWNVMARRTKVVYEPDATFKFASTSTSTHSIHGSSSSRKCGRYIITILHDPSTGYIIVQGWCAGGGNASRYEVPCEIPISPAEITMLLRHERREDLIAIDNDNDIHPLVLKAGAGAGDFVRSRSRSRSHSFYTLKGLLSFEARQRAICDVIFTALRLDSFKHTLTVGQLSYDRTRVELLKTLYTTVWWDDVKRKRTSKLGINIFSEAHRIGNTLLHVSVYETWGDLHFECYESSNSRVYSLNCVMSEVLHAIRDTPGGVAVFLNCVRICRYTPQVIRLILQRLDLVLPGEEGKFWRKGMWGETKELRLLRDVGDCYRGPVYKEQRRVNGKKVEAKVSCTSRGDLRIAIANVGHSDSNGNGMQHSHSHSHYTGPPLHVDIDKESLRLLLKSQVALLKPSRKVELYKYLFDRLDLLHISDPTLKNGDSWREGVRREEVGGRRMKDALGVHLNWTKLTNAPVVRDVEQFVVDKVVDKDKDEYEDDVRMNMKMFKQEQEQVLVIKKDVDKDDQYEIVYEGSWSASNDARSDRHFTARICVTDESEFALSIRRESVQEKLRRFEKNERLFMDVEEKHSRLAEEVVSETEEYAANYAFKKSRDMAKEVMVVEELKTRRRAKNLAQIYEKDLVQFNAGKILKKRQGAVEAAEVLLPLLILKDSTSTGDNFEAQELSLDIVSSKIDKSRSRTSTFTGTKTGSDGVILKPTTIKLGVYTCTIWVEFKNSELTFFAYDSTSSKCIGLSLSLSLYGDDGLLKRVIERYINRNDNLHLGMKVHDLSDFCKDFVEDTSKTACLRSTITANTKSALEEFAHFQVNALKNDCQDKLRGVIGKMLNKKTSAAFNQWAFVVMKARQDDGHDTDANTNVLLISGDMRVKCTILNIGMSNWTDDIRKVLGATQYEELNTTSANKAIYFSRKSEVQENPKINEKACTLANAGGESNHEFYGPCIWAMLRGTEVMTEMIVLDERITESFLEDYETKTMKHNEHESLRSKLREEFAKVNLKRAEQLLPYLKRACQKSHVGDKTLSYIHSLRTKAEKAFPSERLDPYEKPEDQEAYKEEVKRGDSAFPNPNVFIPWYAWSVCLRCHAQKCNVSYSACPVPFCSDARRLAGADGDDYAEKVWKNVIDLQEAWHITREIARDEYLLSMGLKKPMDPAERKVYILQQLRTMGRMLRGFFSARQTAQSRRKLKGAEGVKGWVQAIEEERSILKLKILTPDRRAVIRDGGEQVEEVVSANHHARSSIRVDKTLVALLLGDDYAAINSPKFLGTPMLYDWLLSRMSLRRVENGAGEEEGLGALHFKAVHCVSAAVISGCSMIVEVVQEFNKFNKDGNALNLVVNCTDPSTSSAFTIVLDQERLESIQYFKKNDDDNAEELAREENRSKLALVISKNAESIFMLLEKNGRVQLVLTGESDEAGSAKRLLTIQSDSIKQLSDKRADEVVKRRLQNECRVIRLEEFRKMAVNRRLVRQRGALIENIIEWQYMHEEDQASEQNRVYLTCDSSLLKEIKMAFDLFDSDGSGSISGKEFQELCFELGILLSDKEIDVTLKEIDTDRNGTIEINEFTNWWITSKPTGGGNGNEEDINRKMLAMKLTMMKRAKRAYKKFKENNSIGFKGRRGGRGESGSGGKEEGDEEEIGRRPMTV